MEDVGIEEEGGGRRSSKELPADKKPVEKCPLFKTMSFTTNWWVRVQV